LFTYINTYYYIYTYNLLITIIHVYKIVTKVINVIFQIFTGTVLIEDKEVQINEEEGIPTALKRSIFLIIYLIV